MKSRLKTRVSTPIPDERHLAEVVSAVRAGNEDAAGELGRVFYPGARFLIQRRSGSVNVEQQVAEVLDLVVRTIRDDPSVEGSGVTTLIRRVIVQRFPTTPKRPCPCDCEGRDGGLGQRSIRRVISSRAGRIKEMLCAAAVTRIVLKGPQTDARSVPGDSVQGAD
jgi:hypothetical protein